MESSIYSALIIFFAFLGLSLLIARSLKKFSLKFDTSSSEVFTLLSNSQKALLITCGSILAVSALGFDVSALVAGLGLTGFAIGFALKDAISNLIAGVMIVMYQPIHLDDMISIKGTKGKVVDLNLRYITIQSETALHLVPNSLVLNNEITVHKPGAQ